MIIVGDLEGDGLLDTITKIHCFCYVDIETKERKTIIDYQEMIEFFQQDSLTVVAHNFIRYDAPALEKVLGIKVKATLIDTLAISWYLQPKRKKHGLEEYGEEVGVPKPKVSDWQNDTIETYTNRCETDVLINEKLWYKQRKELLAIYEDESKMYRFLRYLSFKMDCLREQEDLSMGLRIDVPHVERMIEKLSKEKEEKREELKKAMPKVPIYKVKKYPKAITKKDGTLSMQGELWFDLAKEEGVVEEVKEIKKIIGYEEPNPGSVPQVKDWLYSLGWVPETIKHQRNKDTGEIKQIPQIAAKDGQGKICKSIHKLFSKEPKLEVLEGLTILTHRIGLFEGLLEARKRDIVYPTASGFTNTLRLKHSVIVNLPTLDKKYGKEVRGSIIAREGHVLCGSDLSSIEDSTKRHYIYPYDPEYVERMNTPGYDPHIDIGIRAGYFTEEEGEWFKETSKRLENRETIDPEEKEKYLNFKHLRTKAKVVNFSATYKVGAATLSRNSGMSLKEAKTLLDIYWDLNKAILQIENSLKIKHIHGQDWQQNPMNGFWYSLRGDKNRFSTLNQGSSSYTFDIWLTHLRKNGLKIPFTYHDEFLIDLPLGQEDNVKEIIYKSMNQVNERLKLNVTIGCSVQYANSYAECH